MKTGIPTRHATNERGMALVLTLFLTSALTVLAASLMFLSQTETYASMNYKMMSLARYGAEAGVEKAANFLYDSAKYTKPSTTGADLLDAYDRTSSPVKLKANGQPVVLSALDGVGSNYPIAGVVTAFRDASQGTLAAGNITVNYHAYATLISMQTFDAYGGGNGSAPGVVQTWQITSQGSLGGARTATIEVAAIAEQPVWPASSYAAFATDPNCGAIYFHGNVTTNSYDSTGLTGNTAPTMSASGGSVGTNGNLFVEGTVDVNGNLYTPRTGVGSCKAGAIDALTETGNASVNGSVVQLPAAVRYPTPPPPSPAPPTNIVNITSNTGACTSLGFSGATSGWCTTSGTGGNQKITIDSGGATILLPSVQLGSQVTLEIVAHGSPAQQVNINSLDLTGGGTIAVKATAPNQSVLFNLAGKNPDGTDMTTVMDFGGNSGGSFANNSSCTGCSAYDASMMQFIYGGTGEIDFRGTPSAAATIYGPNATVNFNGTADLYGSMLGKTITNGGNANIHYDRRLSHDFYVEGVQMLGTFTWKRF
jgi:Tfp pilus assembly protein PilX